MYLQFLEERILRLVSKESSGGGGTITNSGLSLPSTSRTVNDPAAEARVIAANFLAQRNPNNLLLRLGILNPNEATTRTVRSPGIKYSIQ
jgi:hypothetical protein